MIEGFKGTHVITVECEEVILQTVRMAGLIPNGG